MLYPDDEISLAGVILVFGQDIQSANLVDTAPLGEPGSGARSTSSVERSTVDIEAVSNEPQTHGRSSDPDANTLDT